MRKEDELKFYLLSVLNLRILGKYLCFNNSLYFNIYVNILCKLILFRNFNIIGMTKLGDLNWYHQHSPQHMLYIKVLKVMNFIPFKS